MPRRSPERLPKLGRHATGQAVVRLSGEDIYLGPFGTGDEPSPDALRRYDEEIARWIARGRTRRPRTAAGPTVALLCERFTAWALATYRKRGRPTDGARKKALVARDLAALFGSTPCAGFTPDDLRTLRDGWVRRGVGRVTAQKYAREAAGIFSWGYNDASPRLVPAAVVAELKALAPLRRGRTTAPEPGGVRPAPSGAVEAVVSLGRGDIPDMVRLQATTGMRPAEVCAVRAADIDRSGTPWIYRVADDWNKTYHRGKDRRVPLGPAARALLAPRIARRPDGPLFRTRQGNAYRPKVYASQVRRLAFRAGVEVFSPNRLRHAFATEARRKIGLEATRAILGHTSIETTTIYAAQDESLASRGIEAMDRGDEGET